MFLYNNDKIRREEIRENFNLPSYIPIPVYYSGRKLRYLNVLSITWEALLQHINTHQILKYFISDSLVFLVSN